jgi:hypothetical protein
MSSISSINRLNVDFQTDIKTTNKNEQTTTTVNQIQKQNSEAVNTNDAVNSKLGIDFKLRNYIAQSQIREVPNTEKNNTVAKVNKNSIPTGDELINDYEKLRKQVKGASALTNNEKDSIKRLNSTERQMYKATLGQLASLKTGKIDAGTYMISLMKKADELSKQDKNDYLVGNDSFTNLVGMVFSASPSKDEAVRSFLGTSANVAGSTLEKLQRSILDEKSDKTAAHQGFNDNIINHSKQINQDIKDGKSVDTVTHHFREFFLAGKAGANIFDILPHNPFNVATTIDDGVQDFRGVKESAATRNEGDIRNGMFAAMMGKALAQGKLTSTQVVKMTEWAFKSGENNSPWGNKAGSGTIEKPEKWTDKSLYNSDKALEDWINKYKAAHPGQTF